MGREANVNVNVKEKRRLRKFQEDRIANDIMQQLGPESKKDEGWWHKVAQNLSENEVRTGLEIAEQKKPYGLSQIKYVSGIYANMLKQRSNH